MVPIDVQGIAAALKIHPNALFGRLYYDLNRRFGYRTGDHTQVALFAPVAGPDKDCVNLPVLQGALAGMQETHARDRWTVGLASASLAVSIVAIAVSIAVSIFTPK